jgi:hypothetical protein
VTSTPIHTDSFLCTSFYNEGSKWIVWNESLQPLLVFLAIYPSPFRYMTHDSAYQNIVRNSLQSKQRMSHTESMFTHLWPDTAVMKPLDGSLCSSVYEFCTKIVEQALVLWDCLSDGHTPRHNINKFYTYVPLFLTDLNNI